MKHWMWRRDCVCSSDERVAIHQSRDLGIVRQYIIMGESAMLEIAKENAVTALELFLGQTSVKLFSRAQAMDPY
jgi:hypothetical protein